MIIKCKMCGGDIELSADKTYGTCDYCGSTMTFPKVDDDHRANLFNRANHFRRQNEFDKAVSAYERILNEDNTDAEAHWGVVLSRFGIEYVEDPVSHERIPTCHRVQVTSILTDADYLAALEYAPDDYSRDLYTAEAKRIADIQKGILAISAQEKPYDVFICYKESSETGSRTKDSTIAQDIYYQLKQEGFNVFFARITLEDKLGQQYEPYIFAALNSAKVMLVVGTKPEYFSAVWVKNEWSRYLALMKQDRSRLLIPCYRDMDPYDLPDELSALQSQDMSKIGFMQDLIRGVRKVLGVSQPQQPAPSTQAAAAAPVNTVAPLVKRIFMFLEDGDWTSADEYCEKVLDLDPENAQAYLGKLMASLRVHKQERLPNCSVPFDINSNYQKALRFADTRLRDKLKGYIEHINTRNERARLEGLYGQASQSMFAAKTEAQYEAAGNLFAQIPEYKDSKAQRNYCLEMSEECRKVEEKRKAEQRKAEERHRKQQIACIMALLAVCFIGILIAIGNRIILQNKYNDAVAMWKSGKYEAAQRSFEALGDYRDSSIKVHLIQYRHLQNKIGVGSNHVVGVKADGTVVATGGNDPGYVEVNELKNVVAIDAGRRITVALKEDGTVIALNARNDSEKRTQVDGWSDIVAVATGHEHTVGLKADGTVLATGYNDRGECKVDTWTDIIAVAVGDSHTVGLKEDGTVVATGLNNGGQCNVSKWKNIVAIAAGNYFTVGLKEDGTVVVVGDIPYGTEDDTKGWKNIVAIAAGDDHIVGLTSEGKVHAAVGVGSSNTMERVISSWNNVVAIEAYRDTTVGLHADGTVVAVGAYGTNEISLWNLLK